MSISSSTERFITDLLKNDPRRLENFQTVTREYGELSVESRGYPLWLTIDPTNICSLKCPFCPTGFGNITRQKGVMSMDRFTAIIDLLGPYLLHVDMQNWGEPMLNKDICRMISYVKGYGVHVTMSSNCQHFDGNTADDLVASKLDRLILSIDGGKPGDVRKIPQGRGFPEGGRQCQEPGRGEAAHEQPVPAPHLAVPRLQAQRA
jgi:sulfatase maturation enzyme AslB (radical SAM superfamily)